MVAACLQARTPGDLGGKILAPLWLVFEPAADEGFHVLGIAQWLKLAHAVGIVCVVNGGFADSMSSAGW